MYIVFIILR